MENILKNFALSRKIYFLMLTLPSNVPPLSTITPFNLLIAFFTIQNYLWTGRMMTRVLLIFTWAPPKFVMALYKLREFIEVRWEKLSGICIDLLQFTIGMMIMNVIAAELRFLKSILISFCNKNNFLHKT